MITYFSARFNPLIRKSGKYGGREFLLRGALAGQGGGLAAGLFGG